MSESAAQESSRRTRRGGKSIAAGSGGALALVLALSFASPAQAEQYCDEPGADSYVCRPRESTTTTTSTTLPSEATTTTVQETTGSTTVGRPGEIVSTTTTTEVPNNTTEHAPTGNLAFTGFDVLGIVGAAEVAGTLGLYLVRRSQRA